MSQANNQKVLTETMVMEEGLSFSKIKQRLGAAYGFSGFMHRVVAFYLEDVDSRRLYQLGGCRTTIQFAKATYGMSRREARDLLAAGKALKELPLIDEAFREGVLCWSRVRELIKVATSKHEERWLEKALQVSIDELALEVKLAKQGEAPRDRNDRKGLPEIRLRMNTALPADVFAKWEKVRQKINDESGRTLQEWECLEAVFDLALAVREDGSVEGKKCVDRSAYTVVVHKGSESGVASVETEDGLVPLSESTAEMIACDAMRVSLAESKTGSNGRGDRTPSSTLRNKVLARDGARCCVCRSRHRIQAHHVKSWEDGGATRLDNLLTLCRTCHALTHDRLVFIQGDAKKRWRFEDREGNDLHGSEKRLCEFLQGFALGVRRLQLSEDAIQALDKRRLVRLRDLPSELDASWLTQHSHLIRYNETQGRLELEPGGCLLNTAVDAIGTDSCARTASAAADVSAGMGASMGADGSSDERYSRDANGSATQESSDSDAIADENSEHSGNTASKSSKDTTSSGWQEQTHRPQGFSEMIGQSEVISSLRVAVRAALERDEALGHVLLSGTSGLGKTTIARAVATEMGARLHVTSGCWLKNALSLVKLLTGLSRRDVVFIDEIHALRESVAEVLYEALEDRRISLLMTSGADARTLTFWLEPFTLVGATTKESALSDALTGRFMHHHHLDFYTTEELADVIRRAAGRAGVEIDAGAAHQLAGVSRGTARQAVRLIGHVHDDALAARVSCIDSALVRKTLERLGIDELALGRVDRRYLRILRKLGRPVAIARLARMIGVDAETLERRHEPYLFRLGLAMTTPQGRIALPRADVRGNWGNGAHRATSCGSSDGFCVSEGKPKAEWGWASAS